MTNTVEELKTFSKILYDSDDIVELRYIADKCKIIRDWLPAKHLPDFADTLLMHNGYEYNIYAGANPRRAGGLSKDENVPLARCLFADFDHIETADGESVWDVVRKIIEKSGLPSPTLAINSGHGIHVYWRLSQPIKDMAEWRRLQESLINVLGSDPVIKNPERIMRLPGFLNTKSEPFVPCFILEADKTKIYPVDEIESILQIPDEPKYGNLTKNFNHNIQTKSDQERALDCLASISSCRADDYGDWIIVGMALHHCGLNCSVWDDWSKQSQKYKPGECDKKWESFGKGGGSNVTLGTLVHIAKEDDPRFKATKTSSVTTTTGSFPGTTSVMETTSPESILDGVSGVYEDIINGKRQAIDWPWPQLSKLSKSLINSSITVLCGSPGASKSFMLLQACLYWHQAGVKVALYALEEDREFHLMRVLAQITGKPELSPSGMDWVKDHPDEVRVILKTNGDLLGSFGKRIWQRESTTISLVDAAKWIEDRAKEGCRIIAIDPITIVESKEPWIDDKLFIGRVGKIATDYNCSVIVVSHPVKDVSNPDMSQLAGSTAYSRFVQNILWLDHENEEQQSEIMESDQIVYNVTHNRVLHILKARHGRGSGKRLAMIFNDSLCLEELGLIVSGSQDNDNQESLNYRADVRFKTAEANENAARAKERSAEINKAAVETAERGKTERVMIKSEAKVMLPLDSKKQA